MRVVLVSIMAIVESRKATLLIVREDALWLVHPYNPLVRLGSDAVRTRTVAVSCCFEWSCSAFLLVSVILWSLDVRDNIHYYPSFW